MAWLPFAYAAPLHIMRQVSQSCAGLICLLCLLDRVTGRRVLDIGTTQGTEFKENGNGKMVWLGAILLHGRVDSVVEEDIWRQGKAKTGRSRMEECLNDDGGQDDGRSGGCAVAIGVGLGVDDGFFQVSVDGMAEDDGRRQ